MADLNNTLNQQDLTEINITLHTMMPFFKCKLDMHQDRVFSYSKTNFNKHERIETIHN